MARTIGTKYKNMIVRFVSESRARGFEGYKLHDTVLAKIPAEIFDTWESAESEVERIISDEIFKGGL